MTIALALRCKDGIVVATDGKVTRASTSFREVAGIVQRTSKTHVVPPRALVTGAGELAMIHGVVARLAGLPQGEREKGVEALARHAQVAVTELRAEANARYAAIYGPSGLQQAPRAYFLLVQADPEPRILYVSEDGDLEDQTHLGYAVTGSGDLIVHVRLQPWDVATLTTEQAAVLAFGLVKDTIDSGTFRVSDPVQVWTLRRGEAPNEWSADRVAKLAERYRAFRQGVLDLLRRS